MLLVLLKEIAQGMSVVSAREIQLDYDENLCFAKLHPYVYIKKYVRTICHHSVYNT